MRLWAPLGHAQNRTRRSSAGCDKAINDLKVKSASSAEFKVLLAVLGFLVSDAQKRWRKHSEAKQLTENLRQSTCNLRHQRNSEFYLLFSVFWLLS